MALIQKQDGRIYYRFNEDYNFDNWDAAYRWLAWEAPLLIAGY